MDLLRRIWTSIRPARSDSPPKTAISTSSVVAVSSTDDADHRKQTVKTALASVMLPELIGIIIGYAFLRPYTWPAVTPTSVTTTGAEAICHGIDSRWHRLVAAQPINEGPNRWQIWTKFRICLVGYIAVGISKAPAGHTILSGTEWKDVATADDVLVSTTDGYAAAGADEFDVIRRQIDRKRLGVADARIYHAGQWHVANGRLKTAERQDATWIEFDSATQTMTVRFLAEGRFRQIDVVLPSTIPPSAAVWRPCVTFADDVSATLMHWPDDIDFSVGMPSFRQVL
jgi:hypothetical protein